ncbi:hypothetical protein [Streptosporangium sp. NPDC006007]|uniref:hypothetical protein n=1 Tax=Streptosporangium sp. NPDC006007 TaxID=3154575 RepID=UPI00339DAE25
MTVDDLRAVLADLPGDMHVYIAKDDANEPDSYSALWSTDTDLYEEDGIQYDSEADVPEGVDVETCLFLGSLS